jgi:uncharacterized protein YkwD
MERRRSGRRAWGTAIALLMAGLLVIGPNLAGAGAAQREGRRMQMVSLTNLDREKHDREALRFQAQVSRYAKDHSRAMARKGYIYHSTEEQLRNVLDGRDWSIGGENVGVGGTLESLEQAFMASKLHRENILRKTYDHMAVGIVRADGSLWITVIFYG